VPAAACGFVSLMNEAQDWQASLRWVLCIVCSTRANQCIVSTQEGVECVAHAHHAPTVGEWTTIGSSSHVLTCNGCTQNRRTGVSKAQHAGFTAEAGLRSGAWREHGAGSARRFFTVPESLASGVHADQAVNNCRVLRSKPHLVAVFVALARPGKLALSVSVVYRR
jgi:hypothetical protein